MEPVVPRRAPRVLVVDDDPGYVLLVEKALARQQDAPQVATATDGRRALEQVRAQLPDLVLLDLNMPGMNGHQVLRSLRAEGAAPVVVVLTSSAHRDDVQQCFQARANAYVQKPHGFKELVATLGVVCDHWFRRSIVPTGPE